MIIVMQYKAAVIKFHNFFHFNSVIFVRYSYVLNEEVKNL
jgi:hypothetical protein